MNKTSWSTYTLLAINIVVFCWLALQQWSIMMDRGSDVLAILRAGGNLNPMTLDGEPWRIITSMFLHFGVIHLAVNMFALYTMGTVLEPVVGTLRFTLVYFFCGIVSGLVSLFFNVYVISAGASGALFGLYGYRLGAELVGTADDKKQLTTVLLNFAFFVIINGFITLKLNVDIWGHIGGCIAGLTLALSQFRFRLLIKNQLLAMVFIPLGLLLLLFPLDQVRYYKIFQGVLKAERKTNDLYNQPLSDAQLRDSLTSLLDTWDSLGQSFKILKRVPDVLQQDTSTMRQYIRLHRRETGYRVAMIARESYVYIDSLEYINHEFDSIPAFIYNLNYEPVPPTQKQDTLRSGPTLQPKRVFYNASWKTIDDPSAAAFYRIGQTDSAGRWQGAVRDYFRDGKIQMKGTYKDNLKNGIFLYYTARDTYSSAGRYEKEESTGKWETYFWNGKIRNEAYYNDRTYIRSVWDSLGNAQVTDGNGVVTEWYANGQISETGSYINGRKEGDWFGYHEDGAAYFREIFRDNKLTKGVSVDKAGRHYVYDELSLYAYPVHGMPAFREFAAKHMIRPSLTTSNGLGTVKVVFSVGRDGDLWDFVILDGIDEACNQEAIRLIKEGPPWRSGLLHGHVVLPSQGYAEIDF